MAGSGVNTTTAVSEGQGYGMLLALLNNDQTTFNKIFAAANTYMWNSSHNSYYNWKVVNSSASGQGAATDAELDICLALIFADKLSQNSAITKWSTYNSGGVTYSSRATQMLASIKNNMTSNNYLLPGDNWGSSGTSNLNPSYFATGWMHVFDKYQSTYSFATVATNCYTVLKARSAQWAKGQAPDWCTSSGGQASSPQSGTTYSGLGMTDDACRVPWRICMDALWFDNSDAKTFCSNSRNTLSKYTQSASDGSALLTQMAQYDASQNAISSTAGSFHLIAMWLCGALGSKDSAYVSQCVNYTLMKNICGTSSTGAFGDVSMSDQYYYYNQSLAMLGFAALAGMFPNVLDDTIRTVNIAAPNMQKKSNEQFKGISVVQNRLSFTLPAAYDQSVSIALFDMAGKKVFSRTLNNNAAFGRFDVSINKGLLCPGVYMTKISAGFAGKNAAEYFSRIAWK